jgi:hypothetical protein
MIRSLLTTFTFLCFSFATTAQEAKTTPLCDGKSLTGWVGRDGKPVTGDGWKVEEGNVIHRAAKAGDLYTEKEYADFELSWDWKIRAGGNSGVKYRVTTYGKELLGPEYQMLDNATHADGKLETHRSGCIYDFFPAPTAKAKTPGEWNQSKIVVKGGKFEHWLNGELVCSADTASEAWKTAWAKSKFKKQATWAQNPKGKIMLQDHGDEAWFKNLQIREL